MLTIFKQLEAWGIKLKRKINNSLFAKVFLSTAIMLLGVSLFVYSTIAVLMPKTYSNELNNVLNKQTQEFVGELENTILEKSGGLFDRFFQNNKISDIKLYDENGKEIDIPTNIINENVRSYASETTDTWFENIPILSSEFYFSFKNSPIRYTLVVNGMASEVTELRQAFVKMIPILLLFVLLVSSVMASIYSRIITKPVLRISRISRDMSNLKFSWHIEEKHSDELGILERNLNVLSQKLATTLLDLQEANQKLEMDIIQEKELEQAQLMFFSAASHELKTPITIIKGQLEGMILGMGVYQNREKYLKRTLEVTNNLEIMVQEILTISKLQKIEDKFSKENIDCSFVINNYLAKVDNLVAEKELQIDFKIQGDVNIIANNELIEKIFANLISNAINYSPLNASINISLCRKEEFLLCSIENTGVHIPENEFSNIFEAFYRIDQSRNKRTGGSGLGLYIVQKALQQHNSICKVCNTLDGVKFSFTI